jgi:enamine deaminase RidA (YjgF/YER057c/UK114 family)
MTRRLIATAGSQMEAIYGYSRAVVQGPWIFMSGTTGFDYERKAFPDDVAEQTRLCWETIEQYVKEAGATLADIVRATYYVTDPAYSDAALRISGEILKDIRPAATLVVVPGLILPEMKVEIEVTALKAAG